MGKRDRVDRGKEPWCPHRLRVFSGLLGPGDAVPSRVGRMPGCRAPAQENLDVPLCRAEGALESCWAHFGVFCRRQEEVQKEAV